MPKINLVQAINLALKEEMARDNNILILGEDVGKNGGVFRVTEGLYELYGENRVIDTPLAENAIIGCSIGLAIYGFKPVAELQFDGFSIPSLDQLINHASRIRTRSRGRFTCPLVVRFPYGGGIKALEHHSDSPEAYYCHTPGLKVVVSATPSDAKGLLISSIRDPDPVIFMEPKRIYRAIKEDVQEGEFTIPLGKARIAQSGEDVTVISWGAMVRECEKAAELLKGKINVEIIDLRTLKPLDEETILNSVKKTGRVVVVQEAPRTCSFSAEVAAMIMEKDFLNLEAPVTRVTGWDIVYPLPKLENYYMPSPERIARKIEEVVKF